MKFIFILIVIGGNLRRRLFGDHRGGDIVGSSFRRNLNAAYGLDSEEKIREYNRGALFFQVYEVGRTQTFRVFCY